MTVVNEEQVTSSLLLKIKRTFNYLNTNLNVSTTDANSCLFTEISANLPNLKKGFKYFNRFPTNPTEISINEVVVENLKFKVYKKEKQLVLQFAKNLDSDPKSTFTLFKLFLADPALCTNKDWLKYVVNPNFNVISLQRKKVEFEKDIEEAFTKFYFSERLASFQILIKLFKIKKDPKHPNYEDASDLISSILTPEVSGDDLLSQLLEQLESQVFKSYPNLEPHHLHQVFSEYRVLLEYITILIDGNFSFKASHVHRYIKWILNQGTKKLVDLQSLNSGNYASSVILETCETSLLLHFLQFDRVNYYCDSAPNQKPVLYDEPGVFAALLRDLIEFDCTPSYAILYRAIYMLASTFKPQLEAISEKTESQLLLFKYLNSEHSVYCVSEDFYYNFDSVLVYKQLLELLRCPLFESSYFSPLLFKKSFRLFIMAIATTQPQDFITNALSIVQCIKALYLDDAVLCDQFWQVDYSFSSRKRILQLTTTYFPVYHQPLFQMLIALSGPSPTSIQGVIDYLSELPHFTQVVDYDLDSAAETFQPSGGIQFKSVVAKKKIDIIQKAGYTAFRLNSGTRGCVATPSNLNEPTYVLWSFKYSVFEYLLCLLDSISDGSSAYTQLETHTEFVTGCLQVLNRIVEGSPALLSDLVDLGNIYGNENKSDQIFVHRITGLLDKISRLSNSSNIMLPVIMNLLANLMPAYPGIIVEYLSVQQENFLQLGVKGSIQDIIFKDDLPSRQYDTTIAYLRLILSLVQFYTSQSVLNLPQDSTFELAEEFLKRSLLVTMENIYHKYIHWQYLDNSQRSTIGRLCLEILDSFFKLNPNVLDNKFESIGHTLKSYFLDSENVSYYAPILSLICAAKGLAVKFDSLNMVKPGQEIRQILEVSLTFLNHLFRHYIHSASTLQNAIWNPFTLFEFGLEGPNACSAHVLLNLLDPRLGSKNVMKTADLLTLICLKLCEANDMSLLAIARANLNQLSANLYSMLEGSMVDQPCKRALWIFISATQSHQLGLFKALLQGSPQKVTSMDTVPVHPLDNFRSISDLCLDMVEKWDNVAEEQPWVATAFVEFLHHLWSNKSRCPELLDKFAQRINLFEFVNRLLQNQFHSDDPSRSVIDDAIVSFCINLALLELENRYIGITDNSPQLSVDLKGVAKLLTDNESLRYQFSKVKTVEAKGFNRLVQTLQNNEFNLDLLNNFTNHFWDAHYDVTFQFGPNFSYDASNLYQALVIYDKHHESIDEWLELKSTMENINLDSSKLVASLDRFRSYCAALLVLFKLPPGLFWSNDKAKFENVKKVIDQFKTLYDLELDTTPVTPVAATVMSNFLHELVQLIDQSKWNIDVLEISNFYLDTIDVIVNALLLDGEGDYSTPADRQAYCHFTTLWYKSIDLLVRKINQSPELLDNCSFKVKFEKVEIRVMDLIIQDFQVLLNWLELDSTNMNEPFNVIAATLNVINSLDNIIPLSPILNSQKNKQKDAYINCLVNLLNRTINKANIDMSKFAYSVLLALRTFSDRLKNLPSKDFNQLVISLQSIRIPDINQQLEPQLVYTWTSALQLLQITSSYHESGSKIILELLNGNWNAILGWVSYIQSAISDSQLDQINLSNLVLVQASLSFITEHIALIDYNHIEKLMEEVHQILPKLVNYIRSGSNYLPPFSFQPDEVQLATRAQYPLCTTTTPSLQDLSTASLLKLATTAVHFTYANLQLSEPNTILLQVTTFNTAYDRISFGTLLDWLHKVHHVLHITVSSPQYRSQKIYTNSSSSRIIEAYLDTAYYSLKLLYQQATTVLELKEDKQLQRGLKSDLKIELLKLFPEILKTVDLIVYKYSNEFITLTDNFNEFLR